MFTRCPACDTTFRLGAGDLRRAQGRVRCGECSSVFNALEYLAEVPEEAAAPDSWLPDPANDATPPNDDRAALAPPAGTTDSDAFDFDVDLDTDAEDDDEDAEGAIFVTDPDDDGFSYAARGVVAADTATVGAEQSVSAETAEHDDHNHGMSSTPAAAGEPAAVDLAENLADSDYLAEEDIEQDIDDTFDAAATSSSRWKEALQELEKAETGIAVTAATRTDYLSPDELAEIADETGESGIPIAAEAQEIEPLAEEDFDDTIWERIPGVGSLGASPGRPIDFDEPPSVPFRAVEPANRPDPDIDEHEPADTDADDVDLDPLEFNAPEETWSDIFISSRSAVPDDDDDEFPELPIEDDDSDSPDADDSETGSEFTVDAGDDMARLEQIFNPERIAAMLHERTADRGAGDSTGQQDSAPAPHLVNINAPGTVFDNPARQLGVKAWLTDDETPAVAEDDEFPAEGYDVQHIILPDESQTPAAQHAADPQPAALKKHEAPVWQANEEEVPARKGFWLAGSLLLLAILLIQLIHYNRDSLATSPVWGGTVVEAYEILDQDVFPAWSLDDYEIRSAEAVAGESAADIMDIRAQIAVVGTKPTGLPYLRVVLSDRWSKPVAEKVFAPADYAKTAGTQLDRLLRPGESFEAHVSIVDPGAGAQGFEIELCMPRRHTGMTCTGQPFK